MSKLLNYLLLIHLVLLVCMVNSVSAMPLISGKQLALAGSNPLGMYGTNAIGWNPANLNSIYNPSKMVLLPSIGLSMGNNTFSFTYISDRFVEGDTLTKDEKDDILNKIDVNNLMLNGNIAIPGFAYAENNYAFNFATLNVHGRVALPADLFRLPLNGWETDRLYEFKDIDAEVLAYWSTSISLARSIPTPEYFENLSGGITFNYFIGMEYFGLGERQGSWHVTTDSITAVGHFQVLRSSSGDGVGMDLGVMGTILEGTTIVGFTLGNLVGSVNWKDVEVQDVQFERNKGLDLDSLVKDEYWDSFIHDVDTTFNYSSYTTKLPKYFILAAQQHGAFGDDKLDVSFAYQQGLNRVTGNSTVPRIAIGGEYSFNSNYPLRAGMSLGGIEGFELAGGFGLKFGNYRMDIGGSWQRGILYGAKGVSFALSNQLLLSPK